MDELTEKISEPNQETEVNEMPQEYSDIFVGRRYGYFEILKKAGRNKCYQQEYIVRCNTKT